MEQQAICWHFWQVSLRRIYKSSPRNASRILENRENLIEPSMTHEVHLRQVIPFMLGGLQVKGIPLIREPSNTDFRVSEISNILIPTLTESFHMLRYVVDVLAILIQWTINRRNTNLKLPRRTETFWTKFELNSRKNNNSKRSQITELFSVHCIYLFLSVLFPNYFTSQCSMRSSED